MKGLEPPRLSAPDPKSGAATNYATAAEMVCKDKAIYCITKKKKQFFAKKVYSFHFSIRSRIIFLGNRGLIAINSSNLVAAI